MSCVKEVKDGSGKVLFRVKANSRSALNRKHDLSKIVGTKQIVGEIEHISEIGMACRPCDVDKANAKAARIGSGIRWDKRGYAHCGSTLREYEKNLNKYNVSHEPP